MRNALFTGISTLALAVVLSGSAFAASVGEIDQVGSGNDAFIAQSGPNQSAYTDQTGDFNSASQIQTEAVRPWSLRSGDRPPRKPSGTTACAHG